MTQPENQFVVISRKRWLGWLLLAAVFAVGAVAAVAINTLGSRADRIRRGEAGLARLQRLTYQLSTIEWQAIHTRVLSHELAEKMHEVRGEMTREMQELTGTGLPVPGLAEVRKAYDDYAKAVDREFAMLAAGELEEAEEWDESTVDPAFEGLSERFEQVRQAFDPMVAGLLSEIRTWTYVIVFAALACVGILFWQFNRSQSEQFARSSEQLREARDHAEAANRTKSKFLANMSHELRTPLNAVIGYSEMLAEDPAFESNPAARADLGKIRSSGMHLLTLINDVLDLSKIEAGRMDVLLDRFELHGLVSETLDAVRPLAEKNGNRLENGVKAGHGPLHSDPIKVRQVLFNLVSNACKFTHDGWVHVSARRFLVNDVEFIQIAVADSGIGLTEQQLGKLFNDFTQADAETVRLFGGTGLGLSISRRLCQLLGGDISVASLIGAGSTFAFHIPAEYARNNQPLPASAREVPAVTLHASGPAAT